MENVKRIQQRKFWLVLPLLVTPFIALAFWLMGGGKTSVNAQPIKQGLNANLPSAVNTTKPVDKMGAYEFAAMDTAKVIEQRKQDPYYQREVEEDDIPVDYLRKEEPSGIDEIRNVVKSYRVERSSNEVTLSTPVKEVQTDPELEAINQTLDKLMAIQQSTPPKAVVAREESSMAVLPDDQGEETYFGKKAGTGRAFLDDQSRVAVKANITAIIPSEQILQTGSVVKLQLGKGIVINGLKIPAGNNLYGYASLNGERLLIQIPSIRTANGILPVSLSVYDMDGLEGIHVPGSTEREVIKETTEKAVESTGLPGFDMSLKTQAASAGVGAVKSLLTRKVKQVPVTIAAGYQVLLVDKNQK